MKAVANKFSIRETTWGRLCVVAAFTHFPTEQPAGKNTYIFPTKVMPQSRKTARCVQCFFFLISLFLFLRNFQFFPFFPNESQTFSGASGQARSKIIAANKSLRLCVAYLPQFSCCVVGNVVCESRFRALETRH